MTEPVSLLSEDELAALNALADAATPGPWFSSGRMSAAESLEPRYGPYAYEIRTADPDPSSKYEWPQRICETIMGQGGPGDEPNFAFIAASRQAIPRLLAHIAALTEERDGLKEALKPFAKIEVPRSAEPGTWVARTLHCNDQVTAHSVWKAREALGRHKDSQHGS